MTLLPILVLACSTPAPVPPPPTPAPATSHASAAHTHGAPHGGIVQTVGDKHVEALLMPDGILFWLTDVNEGPLPVAGYTAKATIQGPDGVVTADASPMGDHLHVMTKLAQGKPATVILTLSKDGKAESASFATDSVGMKSHDHTALHGGEVVMRGNWHVEYAPREGQYEFWLSDEFRKGVAVAVSGTVKDGDQVLPLTFDAATARLSAKADSAGTRPVTVDLTIGETAFSLDFAPVTAAAAQD